MRRIRVFPILAAALLAILLGGTALPAQGQGVHTQSGRSVSLEEVRVEAVLNADATLSVKEFVTYRFRGADDRPFTVGTRDFPADRAVVGGAPRGTITSIEAFKDGQSLQTLVFTQNLFEWDIAPARSGLHTYELRYEIADVVNVGRDVVELYRQWVGTTSPEVKYWSAEIRVPDGDGQLRGWAHGPLDGVIEVEDPLITAEVPRVPASDFVETRIAVPIERFDITPGTEELLPAILAEETKWADEANARREKAQAEEERRARVESAMNWAIAPILGLAGLGFWLIWNRWGRDPKRPEDIGDYWREVPDDPPAVATTFLRWGTVNSTGYSATILDLARRGHLTIEEVALKRRLRKDDIEFRFVQTQNPPADSLRSFERRALDWLFLEGSSVTQAQLVSRNREKQTEATSFWKNFQKEVKADLKARKYTESGKGLAFILHFLIVLALIGVAVVAGANEAYWAMAAAIVGAVIMVPLSLLHRSRTPAGTRRYTEWTALRRFLKDFSSLDEAPVGHLALWEHYLVAAVALGVSAELIRGLEVQFPELMDQSTGASFAPWYIASAASSSRFGAMSTFSSDFGTAAVSSFTPASSGSGSGGGFSGGGGGGGGGGGFGAR